MWEQYKKESPFLSMLGMGGGGTGNALGGGGESLWYTKYPDAIPSWDTNTNTSTFGPNPTGSHYGYGTDTFGHYILFCPKSGDPTQIYNKNGQLVYEVNNSTLNSLNTYGGCIDSTRGIIYICAYASNDIYEIDISSDVTTTTDGTPMTFNSSSNNSPSYTVTTWNSRGSTSYNDSICHYYDPTGTSTFWHDKLFTTGRQTFQIDIWNAGNKANQGYWDLSGLAGGVDLGGVGTALYYFNHDWATNGWIMGRRDGPCFYVYNTNRTIDTQPNQIEELGLYTNGTELPEGYMILSDGSLVFGQSNARSQAKIWRNRSSSPSLPSSTVLYVKGSSFTDSGPNSHTITKVGNSLTVSGTSKFGRGSFDFNGADQDQYFYAGSETFFNDSLSSWQFQCWARYTNSNGAGSSSGDMGLLIDQYAGSVSGRMLFGFQNNRIVLRVNGGTVYLENGSDLSNNTWYHIMLNYDGTTHRLFVDGTLEASSTTVPAVYTGKRTEFGGGGDLAAYCLHGYMEHVLVEQGGTVKTANFNATSPFVA